MHLIGLFIPIVKWAIAIGVPLFLTYLTGLLVAMAITSFPAIGLMVVSGLLAIVVGAATVFFIAKVSPLITEANVGLKGFTLPSMAYPECEACSCDTNDLDLENITGDGTSGTISSFIIDGQRIFTRKNSSFLCDVNSNSFWGNTPNEVNCSDDSACSNFPAFCRQRTENYAGGAAAQKRKYDMNSYGIRYALAGYPNGTVQGCPINRHFWHTGGNNQTGSFLEDITYSQRLNLANIRKRYFDQTIPTYPSNVDVNNSPGPVKQNIITTTIENDGFISQPFTDNVMVLLCDPNTNDTLTSGTIITFNNPENINDRNIDGYNVSGSTENQLGTNSITGTSILQDYNGINIYSTNVQYIKPDTTIGNSQIILTGSSVERTYKFKTGVEYFQVITGMTAEVANNYANSQLPFNFINTFFTDPRQRVYYRQSCNDETDSYIYSTVNPLKINQSDNSPNSNSDWERYTLIFLVRGVDVWTEKQTIKYDLSKLFGNQANNITVKGNFYLNVPIQPNSGGVGTDWWSNSQSPESHEVDYTSPNQKLYFKPFNFRPDPNLFSGVTTDAIKYYSALDRKQQGLGYKAYLLDSYGLNNIVSVTTNGLEDIFNGHVQDYRIRVKTLAYPNNDGATYGQGVIEGGSLLYGSIRDSLGTGLTGQFIFFNNINGYVNSESNFTDIDGVNTNPEKLNGWGNTHRKPRLFAPAYYRTNQALNTIIKFDNNIDNVKLIIRSDRLPTSDTTQEADQGGSNGFALYQNDNLTMYRILDTGEVIPIRSGGDSTGNTDDLAEDANSGSTSVLSTFNCEGMVPLDCYSGTGENFGVKEPCSENENPTLMTKGCYKLIQKPYFRQGSVRRDLRNFQEWKTRFRFTFGACRGVISHVFQNNWVNGSLYSFAFKKKTIFNSNNEPVNNIFCGGKSFDLIPVRPNQGPIYLNENTNTFYYRSTPYVLQQNGTNVTGYKLSYTLIQFFQNLY